LSVKTPKEILMIKNSSKITVFFAKKLIEETEGIIDEEIMITHRSLSKKIEDMLED